MQQSAAFTQGRRLSDGRMYVVSVYDLEPAGVLVRAYCNVTSTELTLAPTERELARSKLTRAEADLAKLVASVDVVQIEGEIRLKSSIEDIAPPRRVPRGEAVKDFISNTPAGADKLPDLLTQGLSELCKVKPAGLDAVKWLGEWLLANNPNQPAVDEPEDME
mmetsp:Transcript_33744/g.106634  ORF Transcript_33744/g.106634 Transcript_33744/m.106634 type:complete len:163 (-) Transcript_33744:148-636(-)